MRHHLTTLAVALSAPGAASPARRAPRRPRRATSGGATQVAVLAPQDVAKATRSSISPTVVISGSLDPYKTVDVKAQVGGTITGLRAERGQRRGARRAARRHPGAGHPEPGRRRARAGRGGGGAGRARAAAARVDAQALPGRRVVGDRLPHRAGAVRVGAGAARRARAQASGASESAAHTTITAPISGVVSARDVDDGEAVTAGAKLFTIVDPDTLELAGEIPVQSAARGARRAPGVVPARRATRGRLSPAAWRAWTRPPTRTRGASARRCTCRTPGAASSAGIRDRRGAERRAGGGRGRGAARPRCAAAATRRTSSWSRAASSRAARCRSGRAT